MFWEILWLGAGLYRVLVALLSNNVYNNRMPDVLHACRNTERFKTSSKASADAQFL